MEYLQVLDNMSERAIAILAIVVIGTMETIALLKGLNGVSLSAAVGGVTGCVGFVFGKTLKKGSKNE